MEHDGRLALRGRGDSLEEELLIADLAAVGRVGEVPEEHLDRALVVAADVGGFVGGDELGAAEHGEVFVRPVGGLRDALVGHQAESAVERSRGGAVLLENVRERPEAHGVERLGAAELFQDERPGEERIVDGVDRRVGGIPLRDVDRELLLRVFADGGQRHVRHVADIVQARVQVERTVPVLVESARAVAEAVGVIGDEVERELLLVAVVDELVDEDRAGAGGSADRVILVHGLHGLRGMLVELQVSGETLLVGEPPEDVQIGLVPDLEPPRLHLVRAVTVRPVPHQGRDEGVPLLVLLGRGHVRLPPEDRAVAGRELAGHESELDERLHADGEQEIVHVVDVHEIVDRLAVLVLGVDPHFVVQQAVGAQILEPELLVAVLELFPPGLAEAFADTAGADAVAPDHGTRSLDLREVGFDNARRGGVVLSCRLFFHELAPQVCKFTDYGRTGMYPAQDAADDRSEPF